MPCFSQGITRIAFATIFEQKKKNSAQKKPLQEQYVHGLCKSL